MGIVILVVPFILVFVSIIFIKPLVGFITVLYANYFALGIARYLPAPLGLSVDGLLVLTWLAIFFSQFNKKVEWKKAWNGLTIAAIIWFAYALFQLFNPEAVSRVAWFLCNAWCFFIHDAYCPPGFLLFNNKHYLDLMLKLWAWFTLLGVAKGAMQLIIGPDPWEKTLA